MDESLRDILESWGRLFQVAWDLRETDRLTLGSEGSLGSVTRRDHGLGVLCSGNASGITKSAIMILKHLV